MLVTIFVLIGELLLVPEASLFAAETIHGRACYRFSGNESISIARDVALSMAKRDALEGYSVFVESFTGIENFSLKSDIISTVSAALLREVKVVGERQDPPVREVCLEITAIMEPIDFRQQVAAKINAFRREMANIPTGLNIPSGLPESPELRVVKVRTADCQQTRPCLVVTAVCKKRGQLVNIGARLTWFDEDGIPDKTFKDTTSCGDPGDIHNFYLPMPPSNYTMKLDLF
jgi:hypothetical protein